LYRNTYSPSAQAKPKGNYCSISLSSTIENSKEGREGEEENKNVQFTLKEIEKHNKVFRKISYILLSMQ